MTDAMTIAIIAGSGLGEALLDGIDPRGVKHHYPETPFGRPRGTIVTGTYTDVNIAILKRHGMGMS